MRSAIRRKPLKDTAARNLCPGRLLKAFAVVACLAGAVPGFGQPDPLEEVTVTGRKPSDAAGEALHGFTSFLESETNATPPANLADLLRTQPGVALNGQGGLFQTVSVRGLARQRVGTFFLDLPVTTERRAGTALSFIDPVLVDTLELQRGPATTSYGSGNVAGLIRVIPRRYENRAVLGYGGSGDENLQLIQFASDKAYAGLSRRSASKARTADGHALNTGFTQVNLLAGGNLEIGEAKYELDLLFARGEDIGKSNNLFPEQRTTDYPFDQHVLLHLQRQQERVNHMAVYAHYQKLRTEVLRPEDRLNRVDNASLDVGARTAFRSSIGEIHLNWGADYNGRRRVRADEEEWDLETGDYASRHLLDGEQDDLAVFVDLRREVDGIELSAGGRIGRLWQDAEGWGSRQESLYSAYLGTRWPLAQDFELSAELSSGQRPPSLSERFFSGTTGRGVVLGNPNLASETVYSLDMGLQHHTGVFRWRLHAFLMELDDFVERLPFSDELTTYRNIEGGRIRGIEALLQWELHRFVDLEISGTLQDGERGSSPLQDVPADEIYAALAYQGDRWRGRLAYGHRFAKKDVALQEQPVGRAKRLSASLTWQPVAAWEITVWGSNLLDDAYLLSTDEQATLAEERSLGVRLHYGW